MENYNRRTGVSNVVSNWNRVQPTIVAETTTDGTTWTNLAPTQDGDYNVLTFTNTRDAFNVIDGRFEVKNGPLYVEYLVVGGGGVGGSSGTTDSGGGGGGGGGVATGFLRLEPSITYNVSVGSGGTTSTLSGESTYIRQSVSSFYEVFVTGGGNGGFVGGIAAGAGGCGGGAPNGGTTAGDTNASGFMGNRGGVGTSINGGGGGGVGGVGVSGNGGNGFFSSISGTAVAYGSGGGGGGVGATPGAGASSGGGNGGSNSNGSPGVDGQGGGGGGGGRDTLGPYTGGTGGSGVVIIRWRARGTDVTGVAQQDVVSGWGAVPGTIVGETTTDGLNWTQFAPTRVDTDYVLTFTNTRGYVGLKVWHGRFTVVNQAVWVRFLLVGGGGAGGNSGSQDSGGGGGGGGGVIEREMMLVPGIYYVCVGFRGTNGGVVRTPVGSLIQPQTGFGSTANFGPAGPQSDMPLYGYAPEGSNGTNDGATVAGGQGSGGGTASGGTTRALRTGNNLPGLQPKSFYWNPGGSSASNAFGGGGGGGASALTDGGTFFPVDPVTRVSSSPQDADATSSAGAPGIAGYSSDITGTTLVYGSGGGGGGDGLGAGGTAGSGGGNGGSNSNGSAATANRGGGGGGGGRDTLGPYTGGDGANGVFIIRWSVV